MTPSTILKDQHAAELPNESFDVFKQILQRVHQLAADRQANLSSLPTISDHDTIRRSLENIPRVLPPEGQEYGLERAMKYLLDDIVPTLAQGQAGPRYFGFVTGGTLPSALLTDLVVSMLDANVQVHLPRETMSTVMEKYALDLVLDAMHQDRSQWTGTFTTGATTSNILALSCARQATVQQAVRRRRQKRREEERTGADGNVVDEQDDNHDWDPAEDGLYGPDVPPVRIFVCQAHASIQKSASILGIGRKNVVNMGRSLEQQQKVYLSGTRDGVTKGDMGDEQDDELAEALARAETLDFDLARLEEALRDCHAKAEAAIVCVGMGEVVTGALTDQTLAIRLLCDRYGAWLHMDAAFCSLVCLHDEFRWVSTHMGVCDSLTSDAHKSFNVPYDCGLLFMKKHSALREAHHFILPDEAHTFSNHRSYLDDVCGPSSAGPSYLGSSAYALRRDASPAEVTAATLPSPLNRNLENSRRFRALPVYISLLSQGRRGTREMIERQLAFADRVRQWLRASPYYQVLTPASSALSELPPTNGRMRAAPGEQNPPRWEHDYWATTVVLFRAHPRTCPVAEYRDAGNGHTRLIDAIKDTQQIYVSPGGYCGVGAVRLAVSNWYTGVEGEKDFTITTQVLTKVMEKPSFTFDK